MKRPSNIQVARDLANFNSLSNDARDCLPYPAHGWVGEDSDFPTRYWRVGGNAVIYQDPWGLMVCRWHEFVRGTKHLRYSAQ
jgi:hypothetical protein